MGDLMSAHQQTSTAIPRFPLQSCSGLRTRDALAKAEHALRFFRIAIEFDVFHVDDVRKWALAFSRTSRKVPQWVWDVLDDGSNVHNIVRNACPHRITELPVALEMWALQAGLNSQSLRPEQVLERIFQRRWEGGLAVTTHDAEGAPLSVETQMLRDFADAWAKEKLHREVEKGKASETWPDLVTKLTTFLSTFQAHVDVMS